MRPHIKISLFLLACIALYFVARFAFAGNGILGLDSQPGGAAVFVDGKMKGVTPEMPGQKLTMELSEGEHEGVFKKEGLGSAGKMVIVAAGVIQPLTLTIMQEAFTNPLGMKFVPVPRTKVLMCIHETRNKDYAAYAAENSGVDRSWKNVSFSTGKSKYTLNDDALHPVVKCELGGCYSFLCVAGA